MILCAAERQRSCRRPLAPIKRRKVRRPIHTGPVAGDDPLVPAEKNLPPLLIHTLRTCHAQDFHSAWGSTRRGPRRASCCRDCSPPRPSCSALRTSLCCPGLRGGRRGGLGRTGSRGARSRTAGKGFDDGRGRGGAAGRTRGPARRRPSPRWPGSGTGRVGERGPSRRSRPPWGSEDLVVVRDSGRPKRS